LYVKYLLAIHIVAHALSYVNTKKRVLQKIFIGQPKQTALNKKGVEQTFCKMSAPLQAMRLDTHILKRTLSHGQLHYIGT